jgi:serine/threonine protein phosphatase PrpC
MTVAAQLRTGVASDPGMVRSGNEDRVWADDARGIFLVVDGVGGQAAGEKAAEIAAQAIEREFETLDGDVEQRVRRAIARANNEIFETAQSNAEWRGMACVLTLAVARDERVTLGHVGDSRLYLAWNGALRKMTPDHSPVGEQEDGGELSEREAMEHPRRNEVFRDVGSRPREADEPEFIAIKTFPFKPDAALLLCSDGLSDALTSAEINSVVERYEGDPKRVARELVEAANTAGGKDNISVVFVAGPEFVGAQSSAMTEARTRHAITRARGVSERRRGFLGRVGWLLTGILLGMGLWAALEKIQPRPAAPAPVGPTRWIARGPDPQAISKALESAKPGDTVEVAAGEYVGPVELKEGVTLESAAGAAVIRGAEAGIAVSAHAVKNARIVGFRIVGSVEHPLRVGVDAIGSSIDIVDVEISGASQAAVRFSEDARGALRAGFLHDNPGCGILIEGRSMPRVAGNRAVGNGTAFRISPDAKPTLENNVLIGNDSEVMGALTREDQAALRAKNFFAVREPGAGK